MKRLYIGGVIFSAMLHAPLLKHKEYVAFAVSSLCWPVPFAIWVAYIRYAAWGNYQHSRMIKNGKGCYARSDTNSN